MPRFDATHALRGSLRFVRTSFVRNCRHAIRGASVQFGRAILRRPRLACLAKMVLSRFPSLRSRVQASMFRASLASASRLSNRLRDDADLSPRTVRMLRALKLAARRRPPP